MKNTAKGKQRVVIDKKIILDAAKNGFAIQARQVAGKKGVTFGKAPGGKVKVLLDDGTNVALPPRYLLPCEVTAD